MIKTPPVPKGDDNHQYVKMEVTKDNAVLFLLHILSKLGGSIELTPMELNENHPKFLGARLLVPVKKKDGDVVVPDGAEQFEIEQRKPFIIQLMEIFEDAPTLDEEGQNAKILFGPGGGPMVN